MDETSDPARTYENLLALDLHLAHDVKRQAEALGLRVIEVDDSRSVGEMAAIVAEHFAPLLSAAGVSSDRGA
jgi:hypothetical protein